LVINQLNKECDTTHEKMDLYHKEIRKWESNFYGIEYIHVVRDRNQAADALSKIGSSRAKIPQCIFVQDIHAPSVGTDPVEKQPNEAMIIDDSASATSSHDWRAPFIRYISDGSGLQDKMEKRASHPAIQELHTGGWKAHVKKCKIRSTAQMHIPR